MPKTPREMGEAIAKNLPAKTGRTFEQWVDTVRKEGPPSRAERVAWLKARHGLGTVTANFIAADAEGRSIAAEYSNEAGLLNHMYSGEKAALRPVYDELARLARKLGKDVELTVCKTYVGIRRGRQFAMIKPSTRTRVDLGLTLPQALPGERLVKAGAIGNDRMTRRIGLASKKEIDREVRQWMEAAYQAAAR